MLFSKLLHIFLVVVFISKVGFISGAENDGRITAFDWDFGDGSTSTAEFPTNTYDNADILSVGRSGVDDQGPRYSELSVSAEGMITVNAVNTPINTTFIEAENTEEVSYTGTAWATSWCNYCSGGKYMSSSQAGDKASFSFEGVSISVVFIGGYGSGIADIFIDGQPYPSVDTMNNVAGGHNDPKEFVIATDLAPGQHTIEVVVTGQKGFNFLWANTAQVTIDGFRFGNFPFGTIEGRVLDPDGDGIYEADVEISSDSSNYIVWAAYDGVFNLSGLANGNYTVTAHGPDYVSKTVEGIAVIEGSKTNNIDIILPEAESHELFHNIYSPRSNSPVIRRAGDYFQINVKESSAAANWSISMSTSWNIIDLPLLDVYYDDVFSWTLTVAIPSDTPSELYDLSVSSSLNADTAVRSVQVVDEYDGNYYFAILGDPQEATIEPGQPTFNQIVDEINLINPSFVLIMGDLMQSGTESEYLAYLQAINRLKVPTYAIPGNHDLGSVGSISTWRMWKQYLGKRFGSFDFGNHRFIGMDNSMLHTMDPEVVDSGDYFADQVDWVQSDLATHQDSILRFLFMHMTTNSGFDGDSLAEWKPAWIDDLGVNMVLSGHAGVDRAEVSGSTPVHWVETVDVIRGRYRLVRIENDTIGAYTYNNSAEDSIPYNNLNLDYFPANDGTNSSVVATIENQLQEHFEHALLRFVMPGGNSYQTSMGQVVQMVESADGLETIVYVSINIPPNTTTSVTVSEGIPAPAVTISTPSNGRIFDFGEEITFSGYAQDLGDGDLSDNLIWSSDIDGILGTGKYFVYSGLSLGTHTITATVTNSMGITGTSQISISVGEWYVGTRVSSGTDDAEEYQSGSMSLFSSDLELVTDGSLVQTVGVRFNNLDIPTGANITNAYIQFQVDETDTEATSLTIAGQASDNAETFASTSGNISSRPATTASVSWIPTPWTTVGAAGPDQQTPDITSIVQEIVDRPGWVCGNSIAFTITGSGSRTAESYDGSQAGSPFLVIQYRMTPGNTAPTVVITMPSDAGIFNQGDTIDFSGTAGDAEDGDLTASLAWSSDLDGEIGTGGSFSRSDLSVGIHTITASVIDSGGLSNLAQVTITVNGVNSTPTVSISAPSEGASYDEGDAISFSGTAGDAEDGDLTASLAWSSDLDGEIGTGGSFSRSDLSVGTHTITASVTDSGGLSNFAQVTITVNGVNSIPTVSINAPLEGASYDEGDAISFSGTAGDAEDGDLTASLAWSSNLDGEIGTGGSFSRSDLSVGIHTITASVIDSGGLTNLAQVTITVNGVNSTPTVSISAPLEGASYDEGDAISFSGTAGDAEDGDLTASLAWSSNLDGEIGTGGSFSRSDLSVGIHTITASVIDSGGLSDSSQVTITVNGVNSTPTVSISAPSEGASYDEGDVISFSGTAGDAEDGDLTASLAWSSDLDGEIGTGGSFSRSDLSVGIHTITASVIDSGGLSNLAQVTITVNGVITVPSAPTNLSASAVSHSQIDLIWMDNSDNEDGFELERMFDSSMGWMLIATLGSNITYYSDTGLSDGTTYYYRVRSFNNAGTSSYSNEASTTTTDPSEEYVVSGEIPIAGTISGSYLDTHANDGVAEVITEQVKLGKPSTRYSYLEHKWSFSLPSNVEATFYANAWMPPSSDGDNVVFAFSMDDVIYIDMFTILATSDGYGYASYTFPQGTTGTVYIRATDTNRNGMNIDLDTLYVDQLFVLANSLPASPPAAPSELSATTVSSNQVDLEWKDNSDNESDFEIQRSLDGNTWEQINKVSANVTVFSDVGLISDTTYYYQVRATNDFGVSGYSNIVSITTPQLSTNQIHIGDLDGDSSILRNKWDATVNITVHFQNHMPVQGATVTGIWGIDATTSVSCVTDSNGICFITLSWINTKEAYVSFTVTNVVNGSDEYIEADNHDEDGDSDGTIITILAP